VGLGRKDQRVAEIIWVLVPLSKHRLYARLDLLKKGFSILQLIITSGKLILKSSLCASKRSL
jgi:hypothetical protein